MSQETQKIAAYMQEQTDQLLFEIERLQKKAANNEPIRQYKDFQKLIDIRNSLIFLKTLVEEHDIEPIDCRIAKSERGTLYPIA